MLTLKQIGDRIAKLRTRLKEVCGEQERIIEGAETEQRNLTDEDRQELDDLQTEANDITDDIERLNQSERQLRTAGDYDEPEGRSTDPAGPEDGEAEDDDEEAEPRGRVTRRPQSRAARRRTAPAEPRERAPRGSFGYRSLGEMALEIRSHKLHGGEMPRGLRESRAASGYMQEGVGEDGGFLVAPDFSATVIEKVAGEGSFLEMTDQQVTGTNAMTFPIDEIAPWDSSSGILPYWEGEGQELTGSKGKPKTVTVRTGKIIALARVTDELLEDANALTTYLSRMAIKKIDFAIKLAILQGTGVDQPLGILNAPALITVAKEGSQTADTIVYENIRKMWNRLYAENRPGAVWIANQDIEPQLQAMYWKDAETTTVSTYPVYIPPGGIAGQPYASLFGRPLVYTQACNTLGDKGDIVLADLKDYMTLKKAGGLKQSMSIHLNFDQDLTAFKFTMRLGGQPWLSAPISPRVGSTTYSPFVTLAERA